MKKVGIFFALCLYVLGTIGGIGYALYGGSWPIAIGIALVAAVAFSTIKKWFKEIGG